jgi:hypothetical protein
MSKTIKQQAGKKISKPRTKKASRTDVRKRAYEIYLSRDPDKGSPDKDWFQAEEELMPNPEY